MFQEVYDDMFIRFNVFVALSFLSSAANGRFRVALEEDGTGREASMGRQQADGARICLLYSMVMGGIRVIAGLDAAGSEVVTRRRALSLRRNAIEGRLRLDCRQARILITQDGTSKPNQDMLNCDAVVEGSLAFYVSRDRACPQVESATNAIRFELVHLSRLMSTRGAGLFRILAFVAEGERAVVRPRRETSLRLLVQFTGLFGAIDARTRGFAQSCVFISFGVRIQRAT